MSRCEEQCRKGAWPSSAERRPVVVECSAGVLLKFLKQVIYGHLRSLFALHVKNNPSAVHHEGAVAHLQGLAHVVRDHKTGDMALRDDGLRKVENFRGSCGVKSGGVLVKEQDPRRDHRRHEQRERLALAAGEQADGVFHPVFEAHAEKGELLAEFLPLCRSDAGERFFVARCAQIGDGEVFLNRHVRR